MERPAVTKSPEVTRLVEAFGACARLPHKRLGFMCRDYIAMTSAQRTALKGTLEEIMAARTVEKFAASPGIIEPLYDNAAAAKPLRNALASCLKITPPAVADTGTLGLESHNTPRPRPGYVSPWVIIEAPENANV